MLKLAHIPNDLACHLQTDADPVLDPGYQFDADPNPDFYIMRIRIFTDVDADPGYQNDADPNPQH